MIYKPQKYPIPNLNLEPGSFFLTPLLKNIFYLKKFTSFSGTMIIKF